MVNEVRLHMRRRFSAIMAMILAATTLMIAGAPQPALAACTVNSSLGASTVTYNVPTAGDYYIWARMKAGSSSANQFNIEIDGTCLPIGGSGVSTSTWTWTNTNPSGGAVTQTLTAGDHTFKLVGTQANVAVDRILLTQIAGCTPTGTDGANCPDTQASGGGGGGGGGTTGTNVPAIPASGTRLEAESASFKTANTKIKTGVASASNGKAIGNTFGDPGDFVEFTYNAPAAGPYTLTLRYDACDSLGNGSPKRQLSVNGSNVGSALTFSRTGTGIDDCWDTTWSISGAMLVNLSAGSQKIKFTVPSGAVAFWDVDYLDIVPTGGTGGGTGGTGGGTGGIGGGTGAGTGGSGGSGGTGGGTTTPPVILPGTGSSGGGSGTIYYPPVTGTSGGATGGSVPVVSGKVTIKSSVPSDDVKSTELYVNNAYYSKGTDGSVTIDTNGLPNGDADLTLKTTTNDGSVVLNSQKIAVNNELTFWKRVRDIITWPYRMLVQFFAKRLDADS